MKIGEKRGSWVTPAVAVTVLAAVVAAFWTPVVRLILEPLAWLLWAGWRLLASVDQEIWWVILGLACAVPVIRLFDTQLRRHDLSRSADATGPVARGRVEYWANWAARVAQGNGGREELRGDIEALAASVAEITKTRLPAEWDREHSPAKQVRPRATSARSAGAAILHLLPGFRRRADEQAIEKLLNWMEAALEIRDDEHSR